MTDTTATFHDVTSSDGRIFPLDECRRVIRFLVGGVVIGLGTVAAAGVLIATVTVAAAWIINTALATNPNFTAKAPLGPAAIALADHHPVFASAAVLADAADVTGSIQVSTDPADALTFETKWAHTTYWASLPADAEPAVPQQPVELASKVASLVPQKPVESARSVASLVPQHPVERTSSVASPQPAGQPTTPQAAPQLAAITPEKRASPQQAHNRSMSLPDPDSRTAVYDIAAHTVYLPNGEKLEAHSGLGDKLDDPRYVSLKDRGPTPPNVYDLVLREQLFHDVRAIRLNPVGGDSMFGRDGILAHTYMLGANGQSNGCVSFKNYPAFLHAYLRGEVERLVVVPHLGNAPVRTASARRGPAGQYADNNP
jgi:hypothetical protein